jgi:hypothetical protein
VLECGARTQPELGVDESKLGANRFPGHTLQFSLKRVFPRVAKIAEAENAEAS